jgi:integrase
LQPNSRTHEWVRILSGTTLPVSGSTNLGTPTATQLLRLACNPKVASERLGHRTVGITLALYSHVLPGMQENAAAKVGDALRAAINKCV